MISRVATFVVGSFLLLGSASGLMAQGVMTQGRMGQGTRTRYDPYHPRINEIDQRLNKQQVRINTGLARGEIGPRQAARDENLDGRVYRQMGRDEAAHGGHLTFGEQRRMNVALNRNSHRTFAQRR